MKQMEIERKFVVRELPPGLLAATTSTLIRQGYLQIEADYELRIRQRGTQFWMTLKRGSGLKRLEQECPIEEVLFNMLWPLTEGRRIEKTRHLLLENGQQLEIDVFAGELSPLVLLEVEFESVEKSRRFKIPEFASQEVTEEKAYKNSVLATAGIPNMSFTPNTSGLTNIQKGTK